MPANYKQVRALYGNLSASLRVYLGHFPRLVDADLPFEIAVAYLFQRVERAHRRALYCGIVKRFSANSDFTDEIIQKEHLTREFFDTLFNDVFGISVPAATKRLLTEAEDIRDKAMHGRVVDDPILRKAIQDILGYLEAFNSLLNAHAGFEPCGDLRGFKGRGENLDRATTRLILKGLSLSVS